MRRRLPLPIVIYLRKHTAGRKNALRIPAIHLSFLILIAVVTLYFLDYFPLGNWEPHQPALVSALKTYVSSKISPGKHEAVNAAQSILEQRTNLLLGGDIEEIKENYDLSSTTGEWAYEKANHRASYLRKWALARGVRIVEATSTFEIDSVCEEGDGSFWIELTEHTVYVYQYSPADLFQPAWIYGVDGRFFEVAGRGMVYRTAGCSEASGFTRQQARTITGQMGQSQGTASIRHGFGSRTVHVIEIALSDGKWKIRKDWYTDPLGDDVGEPAQGQGVLEALNLLETSGKVAFDRDKALDYAVKHSGVRALPDGGKYNSKYRVYTFVGGDCANFASQVLDAGGVPQGGGWHYMKEGSTAWVQSESLVWYLLSSGRGYRVFRGKFGEAVSEPVSEPSLEPAEKPLSMPTSPALSTSPAMPPVGQLEPGDIIAYEVKGEIHHVAVVAGRDPRGYVTIASHTADRLYFPWDLGWSENTVFWFIKISY